MAALHTVVVVPVTLLFRYLLFPRVKINNVGFCRMAVHFLNVEKIKTSEMSVLQSQPDIGNQIGCSQTI